MNRRCWIAAAVLLSAPASAAAQEAGTDPLAYAGPQWSPYLVGAMIGVLTLLTLSISGKPVGASSAYAALAGLVGRVVAPRHIASLPYFKDNPPKVDWTLVFVLGAIAGAFVAAWTGGELTGRWVPPMWEARFGADSLPWRLAAAFAGGAIMAFGARMAGGCTSGHGISGTLQLSVGSWVAVICFFLGGIPVALLLYRL